MINAKRIVLASLFSSFLCLIGLIGMNQPAYAGNPDPTQLESICVGEAASSPVCQEVNKNKSDEVTGVDKTIRIAANLLAYLGGFIAVVIMVISGISLITSGGDSNKIANARNSIIYAAAGIVAIIFARMLVLFIINAVG